VWPAPKSAARAADVIESGPLSADGRKKP
jgi:hypothetical protein